MTESVSYKCKFRTFLPPCFVDKVLCVWVWLRLEWTEMYMCMCYKTMAVHCLLVAAHACVDSSSLLSSWLLGPWSVDLLAQFPSD